ncbi:MAG: ABC transporter permease [Thermoplasmata archaeon]|nr:ABC transporter permease [Thermoplasmata archaeon]
MRTYLVVGLLCLSMATMLSVYSSIQASNESTEEMIKEYEDTMVQLVEQSQYDLLLITVSAHQRPSTGTEVVGIPDTYLDEIESLDVVDVAIPEVTKAYGDFDPQSISREERKSLKEQFDSLGGSGGMTSMFDYIITGVPLEKELMDNYDLLPSDILEGRNLLPGETNKVLISEELKDFFDAEQGDTITIDGKEFLVMGIYSSTYQNNLVYMSIRDAQLLAGLEFNEFQNIKVYATNVSVLDGLVSLLQGYFPDYRVVSNLELSARRVENMEKTTDEQIISLESDMEKIESTGNVILLISIAMSGLIVLFILLYTVKERTQEIGTMKALGFTRPSIMLQIMTEGMILAMIGGAVGILVGWLGSPIISSILLPSSEAASSAPPSISIIILGMVAMLTLGMIGSLYPAFIASIKSPVEAMRHE